MTRGRLFLTLLLGSLLARPAAASTRPGLPEALRPDAQKRETELRLAEFCVAETPDTEPAPAFSLGLSPSDLSLLAAAVSGRNGAAFRYDLEGRRLEDDRFTYAWSWRGELVSATVKPCWPVEPLVTPTAATRD